MIPFNVPCFSGNEIGSLTEAVESHKICGDGSFTKKCSLWMEERFGAEKVLLTTSCTSALEMAAILCDVKPGDEVILPSYTFCSTADAFVQREAHLVFVDIRPDTMNIDETLIEKAITSKTKVIVPVHYAGVACEMDVIMDIAHRHNLKVVEDAAQGFLSTYKGRPLGTIGDYGCFSFHETKNYSMGEGGALVLNHAEDIEKAEILREKGTNRAKFFRGEIDKYTWVDYGSSYLPSELCAAYLWPQLEKADEINNSRLGIWQAYYDKLVKYSDRLVLPSVPEDCVHNAHMFYVRLKDMEERTRFLKHMKDNGIGCVFHYVPLHSAPAGLKYGHFFQEDLYTTRLSECLARLPLWYGMSMKDVEKVCSVVGMFLEGRVNLNNESTVVA